MDFSGLRGKNIFISGFAKNCGKTTFLKFLLTQIVGRKAYFSIGMDGEKIDEIYSNLKPRIKASTGDLFLYNPFFSSPDASVKIINSYESGHLMLAETMRGGFVEIHGPSGNHKLEEIVSDLRKAGAETVIIDGAFDRLTQVASIPGAEVFYVCHVSLENLNEIANRISLLFSLSNIPSIKENISHFDFNSSLPELKGKDFFLPGAFTYKKASDIPREAENIILEDLTKVFVDYNYLQALRKEKKIYFVTRIGLTAFVVNLYNIDREAFEEKLKEKDVLNKIIYNPYEHQPLRRT